MSEETQAEKEEREFQEYTAKYCTPSVCNECGLCKHCGDCFCKPSLSEEEQKELKGLLAKRDELIKRNEVIGLLLKMKDNMPDENDLPDDYWDFEPELEAEIEKAAKKLCDTIYPKGEE